MFTASHRVKGLIRRPAPCAAAGKPATDYFFGKAVAELQIFRPEEFPRAVVRRPVALQKCAMTSISTFAPRGNAVTCTVERAGKSVVKYRGRVRCSGLGVTLAAIGSGPPQFQEP